jgi:hypothetical protein
MRWRETKHRGNPLQTERIDEGRKRLGEQRGGKCKSKSLRIRHQPRQHRAYKPIGQRTPVGFLDVRASMIDEMHVMHARRAGRHAGKARQTAIDVQRDIRGRRTVVLQHFLDQVDAPAR